MHDNFIRAILADKTLATEYFNAYLPPVICGQLDFTTLEPLPDTYLSEELQKTMSDIVYVCRKKDSTGTVKVCLLLEHKSYPDKYTPLQIGGYIFSALQKQAANNEPLSVVVPVLLYHGKGKWQYQSLAGLFNELTDEWKPYIPEFSYIYNNLGEVSDEEVEALNNKFLIASLLALKHSFEKEWLEANALKMLLLAEDAPNNLQRSFIVYLFGRSELTEADIDELFRSLSLNAKSTIMSTLDIFLEKGKKEGVKIGIEKGVEIGIEKGVEIGMEKGVTIGKLEMEESKNYQFVKNLLIINRFTEGEIANIANVSEAYVKAVRGDNPQ